jgi:hypothetical protein
MDEKDDVNEVIRAGDDVDGREA